MCIVVLAWMKLGLIAPTRLLPKFALAGHNATLLLLKVCFYEVALHDAFFRFRQRHLLEMLRHHQDSDLPQLYGDARSKEHLTD